MANKDLSELVDAYMDQENLHRIEGRRGVETLCQLAGALGYKDPQYYGQLSSKAVLGDLIMFLEDNPGAIESVVQWVQRANSPEFVEALRSQVHVDEDSNEDEED